MSLNFGAANSHVDFSIGSVANVSNGAFTMLLLWKMPSSGLNSGFLGAFSTGTERRAFGVDTAALFGDNDFSSGFGTLSANDWHWVAITKAAGSNTFRCHYKDFSTAGAWSHGVAAGAATHTDPGTSNSLQVGATTSFASSSGDVAVAAIWTSVLADLTIESAGTSLLSDLMALSPQWAARFMQSSPTSIQDLTGGGGNETGRTGTITATADPPGYDFTLSAASSSVAAPGGFLPPWLLYQLAIRAQLPFAAGSSNDLAVNAEVTTSTGTAFDAAVATTASAELTTSTGSALDAAGGAGALADFTSSTGAAFDGTEAIAAAAAAATAIGAASDATGSAGASADFASSSGTAGDASTAIAVNAGATTATGTAFDATVSTLPLVNAPAELASATGTAFDATVVITVATEIAQASAAALDAATAIVLNASAALGTGVAQDATVAFIAAISGDGRIVTITTSARVTSDDSTGRASSATTPARIQSTDASGRIVSTTEGGRL